MMAGIILTQFYFTCNHGIGFLSDSMQKLLCFQPIGSHFLCMMSQFGLCCCILYTDVVGDISLQQQIDYYREIYEWHLHIAVGNILHTPAIWLYVRYARWQQIALGSTAVSSGENLTRYLTRCGCSMVLQCPKQTHRAIELKLIGCKSQLCLRSWWWQMSRWRR